MVLAGPGYGFSTVTVNWIWDMDQASLKLRD